MSEQFLVFDSRVVSDALLLALICYSVIRLGGPAL